MNRSKITFLAFIIALGFGGSLGAQDTITNIESEYDTRPFQFTFMCPPFSTNGPDNVNIVNDVSLNLFVGLSGGVDGVELASFANVDRYFVNGFQAAGFGNFVGGNVDGFQAAGFSNVVGGSVRHVQGAGFINVVGGGQVGLQGAGFANVVGGGLYGVQGAGFGNFVEGRVTGVQGAGFMNVAGDTVSGVQAAGFMNIAEASDGGIQAAGFGNASGPGTLRLQAAGFMNIADDIEGLQAAGFFNKASYVKGVQAAGFLNICDSIDGVPIAFINIVKHGGYRSFELSASETQYLSASFRMGVEKFYTIFSFGKAMKPGSLFMYGAGFGTQLHLPANAIMNIEAMTYQQLWIANEEAPFPIYWDRFNMQNQLRVLFGWQLGNFADVFLGPTLNISIANTSEYSGNLDWQPIAPKWAMYDRTFDTHNEKNIAMWFGLTGGIRF